MKSIRPYLNLLLLGIIYNTAFKSFQSDDIESSPVFFRTIQVLLITFMFLILYMNKRKFNMDKLSVNFSAVLSGVSVFILLVILTFAEYEDHPRWKNIRESRSFENIDFFYKIIPKSILVFMLLKEVGNNITEIFL